mgnify:CR=1 FL=1|jgi:hypothetical protein
MCQLDTGKIQVAEKYIKCWKVVRTDGLFAPGKSNLWNESKLTVYTKDRQLSCKEDFNKGNGFGVFLRERDANRYCTNYGFPGSLRSKVIPCIIPKGGRFVNGKVSLGNFGCTLEITTTRTDKIKPKGD